MKTLIEFTSGMMHGTKGRKTLGYYTQGHVSPQFFYRLATEAGLSVSSPRQVYWAKSDSEKYEETDPDAPFAFPVTVAMLDQKKPVEAAKKIDTWRHPTDWQKGLDPWTAVMKNKPGSR